MKYPARLLYFFGHLIATYVVLPIIFFVFYIVYFVWNLKPISKEKMRSVTEGWQEVRVGCGTTNHPEKVYKTPFHYLTRKEN